MKRIALLVDAAADLPYAELQDQTPLQQARLPFARELAVEGCCGALRRMRPEADASRALLAECCGLSDPEARELRWGPVAAAALGLPLNKGCLYVLAGFVQVDENRQQHPVHPSSLEEQMQLLSDLQSALCGVDAAGCQLHSFSLGRFVIELRGEQGNWPLSQVQYAQKLFLKRLPPRLQTLLDAARKCLQAHPVNAVRLDLGEAPIEGLWCWSGGSALPPPPGLPFGQALVSPDPLAAGMAGYWQLPFLKMEDPYTLDRPDAAFDVFEMMKMLENRDEIVIWIPAPFSTRRFEGSTEKVRRLDAVDYYVTGPVKAILEEIQPSRFLLLAAGVRHHGKPERGAAPFVLWGAGLKADPCLHWTEIDSMQGSLGTPRLTKLLEKFRKET